MEQKNIIVETCPRHSKQSLDLYCENCSSVVCIRCRVTLHGSHYVVTRVKKCRDLKKKLEHFERVQINKERQNSKSADKVKEAIRRQHRNVKSLLLEALRGQIAKIDFDRSTTDQGSHLRTDASNTVSELLSNVSYSSSFIEKSTTLLKQIEINPTPELTWNMPRYVAPNLKLMRFTPEFNTVAESLLGHCSFEKQDSKTCQTRGQPEDRNDSEENSAKKVIDFQFSPTKPIRSQSLVEISTSAQTSSSELGSSSLFSNSGLKHENKMDIQAFPRRTTHPEHFSNYAKSSGYGSQGSAPSSVGSIELESRRSDQCISEEVSEDDFTDQATCDNTQKKTLASKGTFSTESPSEDKVLKTEVKVFPKDGLPVDRGPPALVNTIMDFLKVMVRIVILVRGEPCVVQAENSQVKLHVPKGVYGAILANVHTNHARFMHHVPNNDCVIAPVREYHLQEPYRELILDKTVKVKVLPPNPEDIKFRIEIPHILKDVDYVRPHIRVRHGNLHSGVPVLEKLSSKHHNSKISFDIDDNYITIHTNHFSGYIVSAKHINCCAKSANVHLFASLRNIPEARPLATVKVYLSSILSSMEDYQCYLRRKEQECQNPLFPLQNYEIILSSEEYDASESEMMLMLVPDDQEVWKSYMNRPTFVVKKLHEALTYINGHICKMSPTQVAVFSLESSKPFQKHLRAILDISVKISKTTGSRSKLSRLRASFSKKRKSDETCCTGNNYSFPMDILDNNQRDTLALNLSAPGMENAAVALTSLTSYAEELTNLRMFNLSQRLSTLEELRSLAIKGLKIENHERHVENNKNDITTAAYSLLREWCNTQKDRRIAYVNMCDALRRVGRQLLIKEELQ